MIELPLVQACRSALSDVTAQDHQRFLIMSPNLVRARWDELAADPDNPRPELGVDEWLAEAEAGNLVVGGYKIVLQREIPTWTEIMGPGDVEVCDQ